MKQRLILITLLTITTLLSSCDSSISIELTDKKLANKVNKYIKEVMSDAYLWYKQMPDLKTTSYDDPKAYFNALLYQDDKWSYITDDATTLTNSLSGIETTFGYELAFYRESNTDYVFAVVKYVNPNTPASQAGIKRGDIFVKLNNQRITTTNYTDLIYATSIVLTYATIDGTNIIESDQSVALTAEQLNINPIQLSKVFDINGTQVGYLHYTSYVAEYNTSLETLFTSWLEQGVTEVILDLRYNGGGSSNASTYLCSCLAPKEYVDNEAVLIYNQWNDRYEKYWRNNGITAQYERRFIKDIPCNMNLARLFILTTGNSASASELTIVGLSDYMQVITIGETTYGKYTSMVLFQPEDEDINNWALLPIVAKYTSVNGTTDFKDGLTPTYEIEDELLPAVELGDTAEPLLAKAISIISGEVAPTPRKAKKLPNINYQELPLERIKNNDFILIER